nr:hypothetical protein Iba_chr03eCG9500 [Ipomoea batatas]
MTEIQSKVAYEYYLSHLQLRTCLQSHKGYLYNMFRSAREGGQQHPHHLTSTFVLSSEGLIHGTKNHDVEMAKPQLHCKSHKCTKIALSFLALPHPSHLFQTAASQLYEHSTSSELSISVKMSQSNSVGESTSKESLLSSEAFFTETKSPMCSSRSKTTLGLTGSLSSMSPVFSSSWK